MRVFIFCILAWPLLSKCTDSQNPPKADDVIIDKRLKAMVGENMVSAPDFIKISDSSSEVGIYHLQTSALTDSSGPYYIREYVSDTLSFTLVFFPIRLNKDSVDFELIEKAKRSDFEGFVCYSFVYPMISEKHKRHYQDDNVAYPVHVKSFVRNKGVWQFLNEKTVGSLEELAEYEVTVMYKYKT